MRPGELLRTARTEAVRYGRRTREDASELAAVFARVAGLQLRDTLAAAERRAASIAKRRR